MTPIFALAENDPLKIEAICQLEYGLCREVLRKIHNEHVFNKKLRQIYANKK